MQTSESQTSPASSENDALMARIVASSPFRGGGDASRAALLEIGRPQRFVRRQRLVEQGEAPRWLVLLGEGRVKLERLREGRVFTVAHRGPGELVGETAVVAGPATESATAVEDVVALVIPLAEFRELLSSDAAIRSAMTTALVNLQLAAEGRLGSLLLRGVEARLSELLLSSLARWGTPHELGEMVAAPFTHADIALLIGSTRETVTLLLGRMKRAGLIAFERRRVIVTDRAGLERRVAGP